ncbi:MAG: OmpW family protein [Hyphomicrobiales bacterium]|nr:OmpW family protein [Hyphomicrobiales bacterium]
MKKIVTGVVSALFAGSMSAAALAADLPSRRAPAAAEPAPMFVDSYQPFQIRLKATAVIPDGKSAMYDRLGVLNGLASFGPGSQLVGYGAKPSISVIPEVDLAYYFNRNFAVETICCISHHDIKGSGFLSGANIGSAWVIPATVLFQYHFTNFGAFQPYVGVGPNFNLWLGEKGGNTLNAAYLPLAGIMAPGGVAVTDLKIKNNFGIAGQIGFDYMINQNWGINVDLKRYLMRPTAYATVWSPAVGFIPVRAKVNVDPWLVSAGLTYRFGGASGGVVAKY